MLMKDQELLDFLFIIGIRGSNEKTVSRKKIIPILLVFLYITSMFHYVSACLFFTAIYRSSEGVSYIIEAVNALIFWYSLMYRRKKILNTVHKIFIYRKRYQIDTDSSRFYEIFIIIIQLVMLFSYQIILSLTDVDSKDVIDFWTFNTNLPRGIWKTILLIVINIFQYITFTFPVLLSLIVSVLFHKIAEILQIYKKRLLFQLHFFNKQEIMIILRDYFNTQKNVIKLYQILNYPTFFLIAYSTNCIFTSILLLVKHYEIIILDYLNFIDVCADLTTGIFILVPYIICCSKIAENSLDIKKTVQDKLNEFSYKEKLSFPESVIKCLERIEKSEIPYMSVCGLFVISRGFILTATGAALTYGLLIINLL